MSKAAKRKAVDPIPSPSRTLKAPRASTPTAPLGTPKLSDTAQELLEVPPELARMTLERYKSKYTPPAPGEKGYQPAALGWEAALFNRQGCWLAQARPSRVSGLGGYIQVKLERPPRPRGANGTKQAKFHAQGLHRVAVVAYKVRKRTFGPAYLPRKMYPYTY